MRAPRLVVRGLAKRSANLIIVLTEEGTTFIEGVGITHLVNLRDVSLGAR